MKKPTFFFVFDVESIGLHGDGFAVAGGVFGSNGAIRYGFAYACHPNEASAGFSAPGSRRWVNENVPILPETHRALAPMRSAFWSEWTEARRRYRGILMAAEVPWPVEAKFLADCIRDDHKRADDQPYPLIDIASVMFAAGMDPMATYDRTQSELPRHNPYADAMQSARLLSEALAKLNLSDE